MIYVYPYYFTFITHGQPVVRRVQFPSGVQDSTSAIPLLKKPELDKEQISNLTSISKVIERLVLDRLRPHLL